MSDTPLLDPAFLKRLELLWRRLQVRTSSGATGDRSARLQGSSAEFLDHRAYIPGDDPRSIDWSAYARSAEPVVKLFRSEEDLVVRLLVDASASMAFGKPSKVSVACRLAAALGYIALAGSERAQVMVIGAEGPQLRQVGAVRRGKKGVGPLFSELSRIKATGRGDLSRAVEQLLAVAKRPGMLIVISDFFDTTPALRALDRARSAAHDVGLVQVLARQDVDIELDGDLSLVDAETGERVDVTMDARALDAYAQRLEDLKQSLRSWARSRGARYTRLLDDEPIEPAVLRFLSRAVD